ncbi:proline iminopeptidase-family hydrolase [Phaeodactylibacter sp.]|uniref:proline iminopeptidase-family hydrolase n=1 Tax=Phaeodactylibacter sp. TaxID=1940289 RepID=UPI0025F00EA8|nr:proline iminopeptidase-family hydrolase [Phaeodactylibacter sp.]MCI4651785.1 proline iminopeptidase-family hydrolase [Phaeodactylibacter sp.]MCI5090069.1 proline iminopeptidase-family hydrolase [Phaeodactylibacter sp.]
MKNLTLLLVLALLSGCSPAPNNEPSNETPTEISGVDYEQYLDYSGMDDKISGGAKRITINTPSGEFQVWTKRVGNNPTKKVLLLHGGPGATHEYFEVFDSYFPKEGIEYYYYDQLGSHFSDQPEDTSLWNIPRFVEEVEQVRQALGLNKDNFYILGHSWGGILGIEYALKYQENLKGLIISNMMSSIPAYVKYAEEELAPGLPADALAEIRKLEAAGQYTDERYLELVETHYYPKHVLRMPLAEWPDPVIRALTNINYGIYLMMQGPSEFGVVGDATLKEWDRTEDLAKITVPTLSIGAEYDTMDPDFMEMMAGKLPNGSYHYCPEGAHWAMYDDADNYFKGVIDFVNEVDAAK